MFVLPVCQISQHDPLKRASKSSLDSGKWYLVISQKEHLDQLNATWLPGSFPPNEPLSSVIEFGLFHGPLVSHWLILSFALRCRSQIASHSSFQHISIRLLFSNSHNASYSSWSCSSVTHSDWSAFGYFLIWPPFVHSSPCSHFSKRRLRFYLIYGDPS